MLRDGLIEEIRLLLANGLGAETTAMQAIGYKEFLPVLQGVSRECDAAEEVKKRSRNYAKRQLTWFRRNSEIHWITYAEANAFEDAVASALSMVREALL